MSADAENLLATLLRSNPWLRLPTTPPFVLEEDQEPLERHRRKLTGPFELKLDIVPQPWTGDIRQASVLMLALNPGFGHHDYSELQDQDYAEQWRLALSFGTRTPFYFLDPAFSQTGGYRWWQRRLRHLIEVVGGEQVAARVMCIEHFPYKSEKFRSPKAPLPSQQYSFDLVRYAICAQRQIVVMRSERAWLEAVPELRSYRYIRLSNHQNPYLSRAQMTAEQFDALCGALA